MDENKRKADYAVSTVMKHLVKIGYTNVKDVTKDKKDEDSYGCDILAINTDGKKEKIEVKASANEKGIPDCHDSLFNEDKTVKADFFYIVRLDKEDITKIKKIEVLTKEQIDQYKESHRWIKRLRTTKLDSALYEGKIGREIQPSEL